MVTELEHDEAIAKGEEMFKTLPHALGVHFDANSFRVVVDLNWGYSISFSPERSQDLHHAKLEDLQEVEIGGVGWEIYFPRLDSGLWVPGLAKGIFGTQQWEEDWAAKHMVERAVAA